MDKKIEEREQLVYILLQKLAIVISGGLCYYVQSVHQSNKNLSRNLSRTYSILDRILSVA